MLRRVEYAVRLERGRTRRVAEQKALEVSIYETEPDKACIRQIAEQRRQHELAQSLLTKHSLRQALTPAAPPRRAEWAALRSTEDASNNSR